MIIYSIFNLVLLFFILIIFYIFIFLLGPVHLSYKWGTEREEASPSRLEHARMELKKVEYVNMQVSHL